LAGEAGVNGDAVHAELFEVEADFAVAVHIGATSQKLR
jgi:hypothetical protein